MHFKIDCASLIVGSKFTVFALFYFVFEGSFPSTSPRGAYIWRVLYLEGLIFGIYGISHIIIIMVSNFNVLMMSRRG